MKTESSKKWTKMTLKCEVSFCKCDKCEVKYSWQAPLHSYCNDFHQTFSNVHDVFWSYYLPGVCDIPDGFTTTRQNSVASTNSVTSDIFDEVDERDQRRSTLITTSDTNKTMLFQVNNNKTMLFKVNNKTSTDTIRTPTRVYNNYLMSAIHGM